MGLIITAEATGGSSIERTAEQMQRLADQLGVTVRLKFNDVTLLAVTEGTAAAFIQNYYVEIQRKPPRPYKIVSSHERRPASVDRSGEAGETPLGGSTVGESAARSEAKGDAR